MNAVLISVVLAPTMMLSAREGFGHVGQVMSYSKNAIGSLLDSAREIQTAKQMNGNQK